MSPSRRSAALLAVLPSLTLVLAAAPASAHTELVSGTPSPGAMVNGAISDLTLTFVSSLVAEGTQVVVRDPSGANHAGASTTLGPQARVQLEPLTQPGTYTVTYRAVAGDGHPITGGYAFRVSGAAAAAARSIEPSASGHDGTTGATGSGAIAAGAAGTGSSSTALLIGGAGAAGLVVLLAAGAKRRPEHEEAYS
jgi:methionine-rich copper-binding protein CopC